MKIKLFRSATLGINTKDYNLLTDPWLTDGEYYGSWCHFPYYDLKKNIKEINSYNGIYISHIHPDHCSETTLKSIDKSIPIYIHTNELLASMIISLHNIYFYQEFMNTIRKEIKKGSFSKFYNKYISFF